MYGNSAMTFKPFLQQNQQLAEADQNPEL